MPDAPVPKCRDCGTLLRQIDDRPGKEAWICPIALEAQRRGLLGQPGRKHKAVWVYEKVPVGTPPVQERHRGVLDR